VRHRTKGDQGAKPLDDEFIATLRSEVDSRASS